MKRIYACLAIVAALLVIAFYSSFRVQQFAEEISEDLDNAMEAIRDEDLTGARQALAEGAELCDRMPGRDEPPSPYRGLHRAGSRPPRGGRPLGVECSGGSLR